jgi:hypothetical protein
MWRVYEEDSWDLAAYFGVLCDVLVEMQLPAAALLSLVRAPLLKALDLMSIHPFRAAARALKLIVSSLQEVELK